LRFLEKEEIERLIKHASPHTQRLIVFAINTGTRRSEMLNLKWSGVDLKNGFICIHKTKINEKRIIPLNNTLRKLLLNIREHIVSEYVFCTEEGKQIKSFRTGFEKALKRAQIKDCVWHTLRHSFASHMIMSGADLNTVKELLGHKNIEMTMRYSHLSQDHKARAVEVLGQRMDTIWTPVEKKKNADILYYPKNIENNRVLNNAPVAQSDRAFGYGPEGCRFESCRAHVFLRTTMALLQDNIFCFIRENNKRNMPDFVDPSTHFVRSGCP